MKPNLKLFVKQFGIELLLYALLIIVYFLAVLHLLGDWLNGLFHAQRGLYAAVSLGLMLGQGWLLEVLTSVLLRLIRRWRRE